MLDKDNNYEDMEAITIRVIKILLKSKVLMDDIMNISGKTEEEINKIKEMEE